MKKLEISQMENLQGGISGRNCFFMGAAVAVTGLASIVGGGVGLVLLGGSVGGFFTAASNDCF